MKKINYMKEDAPISMEQVKEKSNIVEALMKEGSCDHPELYLD